MSQRHLCTHLHLLLLGLHIRIPHRRRLHLQLSLYPMSPFLLLLPLPRHMADVPIHLRGELHVSRDPPQPSQSLGTSTRGPSQFQVAKRSVVLLPIMQKAKRLGPQILGTIRGKLKCVFIPLIAHSVFLLTVTFRTSFPRVLWASDWNRRLRKPGRNATRRSGRVRTRRLLLYNAIVNIGCAHLTALITTWALHIATGLQVIIGALTTALGAALSGKNVRVSMFSTCRNQSLISPS